MKIRFKGRKGTITLFLCIILSAAIILESIYIKGAYRRKQEVILTTAVSHQVEQILSQFNRNYQDWYGIYVLDSVESDHAVFDEMTKKYQDMSFQYELTDEFTNDDLRKSISEYMRLRGLAFEGSGIMDRLGLSIFKLTGTDAITGSGISSWLPTFQDYFLNREEFSEMWEKVEEKCAENGLEDKLTDFYSFVDDLDEVWKKNVSAVMEIGDTTVPISLFDTSCVGYMTSAMDKYMDYQLPSIVDRLLINEYAAFSFDSRVKEYEENSRSVEEANIIGIPFSEIHGENTCDLEYLLVGSSSSGTNKNVSYGMILGTRLILDFSAFLMDESKMELAFGIAEVISILVFVSSFFTVYVDPVVIQYTIIFFMAFMRAVSDTSKLTSGKKVPLFYNYAIDDYLQTTYRDYFRVFLLFVPENELLDRMNTVIRRDCSEHLYTGVSATGKLSDDPYSVKRRFELYEKGT